MTINEINSEIKEAIDRKQGNKNFFYELGILFLRYLVVTLRNPRAFRAKIMQVIIIGILAPLIYLGVAI